MPFGFPVSILGFVSVVEVDADCDSLASVLLRHLHSLQNTLSDMLVVLQTLRVTFPVHCCQFHSVVEVPLNLILLLKLNAEIKR